MSAINFSGLSSLGNQYDFTSMTNLQLKNAALELGKEGKITTDEQSELVGAAEGMYVYTPGDTRTADQVLNDPTAHNFADYFAGCLKTSESAGISQKTTDLLQSVVDSMQQYQGSISGNASSDIAQHI